MADKALYVLAGYDDRTEEILAGMQNKLYESGFSGVQTKNIPMHFTLGSYDTEQEEELKARLTGIAETDKAFSVSFNHAGLFRLPQNDVLFIAPEDTILKAIPLVLDGFTAFDGKVATLHLYEFWPTRHILSVRLK